MLLIRLQLGGWLRYILSGLRTPRGALLGILGFGVLAVWLTVVLMVPTTGKVDRELVPQFGPAFLLLYCFATVLFSPHDRGLYFAPAEVQFLFTGPFTRRQVLAYKVVLTLMVSLPMALIFGIIVRIREGWLPAVAIGLLLMMTFLQLFTLVLGLLGTTLGASLYTRGRQAVAVVVGLVVLGLVYLAGEQVGWDRQKLVEAALKSTAWKVVSWPVQAFFYAMVARDWSQLWQPALGGLALNVGLLVLLFGLDAQFLEASAASSANMYARMLRAQGKQVNVEVQGDQERKQRWGLPMLPYLGGIGPILWRQLTTAFRSPGRFTLLLLFLGGVVVLPWFFAGEHDQLGLMFLLLGMVVWLSVFLPVLVPFDFRGDIDRIATLKALPIVPWRLALGQVLTPAILMTLVHWSILLGLSFVVTEKRSWLALAAVFAPAFNFYTIAVDNLLFLFFPVRIQASTPGDFQAVGRNVLLSMGKLLGLMVPAVSVGLGVLLATVTGHEWLAVAVAIPPTLVMAGALILVSGQAFEWFDVGRNSPA
jgi:hypothetical protein